MMGDMGRRTGKKRQNCFSVSSRTQDRHPLQKPDLPLTGAFLARFMERQVNDDAEETIYVEFRDGSILAVPTHKRHHEIINMMNKELGSMAVSRLRFFPRQNLRFPSLFRLPSSSTHR
jgi:hypothetical protein